MSNVSMINGHIDEPKGLTDEQITKALECCAVMYDCPDCPFEDDCGSMQRLSTRAIDLIKRQKEQINGLIAGQQTLQKHLAEKNAVIERLHTEGLQLNGIFMDFVNVQKAEAIKEFAKRLKGRSQTFTYINKMLVMGVPTAYIDNLVKEMID